MSETATTPPLSPQDTMKLSKLLAYVLRHGAVNEKLTISPDGYIAIQDLVKYKNDLKKSARSRN
jgi:RNA:NAD 2'-phosphotransferase (TPT1/KptA family)